MRGSATASWGAAALIAPHLALGTWLLMVPDHLAFTAAQVVTLAHVGLALVTLPLVIFWLVLHVRAPPSARPTSVPSSVTRWVLVAATIVAVVTGFIALWGGDIVRPAALHAWCSVAVGVPLAAHLWLSMRRWAAGAVAALLAMATAGSAAARRWLPPAPLEAAVPSFDYVTRPAGLYEPAENCGECHEQDFQDWKQSTHARTMGFSSVKESMQRSPDLLTENLQHVGQLVADPDRPLSAALVFGACGSCHSPTSFYGDGHPSLTRPSGLAAEGTGCSFCHTLREVRRGAGEGAMPAVLDPSSFSRADIFALMSRAPFYVSAPETVRRYFFQGSGSPWARRIANYLIRWRPAVHASDYHSPVLDDSRACLACHSLGIDSPEVPHMTYYGWEHSAFSTGDPKTTVSCQDCHMVRRMTGEPVREQARMVPWGPVRQGARSHLFLGGNVQAALSLGDPGLAQKEHDLNASAATIGISQVQRNDDALDVTVAVRSERVGHYFPALETKLRYGWIEVKALDASGAVVARTSPPKDSEDFGAASALIMSSVDDPKRDTQRLVAPRTSREFTSHLALPTGARVQAVVAELYNRVDPAPIATTSRSLPAPDPPL